MANYVPDFSRNPKGKYDPRLNFISVKGGTDAYLLEDELNELQWIQSDAQADLIRKITNSGVLHIPTTPNSDEQGAWRAHNFLVKNQDGTVIQNADVIKSSDELNVFTLNPFDAVLNGYITHIESDAVTGLQVHLTKPYATGERKDLVILEFWYKELQKNDPVPLYGGVDNGAADFTMIDPRVATQTTNRVQLQWRIRCIPGDFERVLPYYNNGEHKIEELKVHPQGPNAQEWQAYTFRTADNDSHLFIAGNGEKTDSIFRTMDGYIYAIPLVEVNRLNQSGYSIENPSGAKSWNDDSSVSDRVSLDGKFANVIYTNDITENRHLSALGEYQMNDIFLRQDKFDEFNKKVIEQNQEQNQQNTENISNLETKVDADVAALKKEIEFLTVMSL